MAEKMCSCFIIRNLIYRYVGIIEYFLTKSVNVKVGVKVKVFRCFSDSHTCQRFAEKGAEKIVPKKYCKPNLLVILVFQPKI